MTSGKALYVGVSSHSPQRTREMHRIFTDLGTPLLIHQPSYSLLNRWIEDQLIDTLGQLGVGCIAFSPLAQGLLTDRYLDGVRPGSRASRNGSVKAASLTPEMLDRIRGLDRIARSRGESLAQMAVAWATRDPRVTSVLVGASSVGQLEATVGGSAEPFTDEQLRDIDLLAVDADINLWKPSSDIQ